MKKISRILSLILLLAMIATLCVGCSGKKEETAPAEEKAEAQAPAEETEENAEEETEEKDDAAAAPADGKTYTVKLANVFADDNPFANAHVR